MIELGTDTILFIGAMAATVSLCLLITVLFTRQDSAVDIPEDIVPSEKALEIAAEKAENREKLHKCLWRGVCPKCGFMLIQKTYGTYDQFTDSKCKHCGFKSIADVLA